MNTKTYAAEIIESILGADFTLDMDNAFEAQIQYAMDQVDYQNERIASILDDVEADIRRIRQGLTTSPSAKTLNLHSARDLDEAVTTRNLSVQIMRTMSNAVLKERAK